MRDLYLLLIHMVLAGVVIALVRLGEVELLDFALGFFLGITLYSFHWWAKHKYWPD